MPNQPLNYEPNRPRENKRRPNVPFQGLGAVLGTFMVLLGLAILGSFIAALPEFQFDRRPDMREISGLAMFLLLGVLLIGVGARWIVKTMKSPFSKYDPDQ